MIIAAGTASKILPLHGPGRPNMLDLILLGTVGKKLVKIRLDIWREGWPQGNRVGYKIGGMWNTEMASANREANYKDFEDLFNLIFNAVGIKRYYK
jgi:hypothetical protein